MSIQNTTPTTADLVQRKTCTCGRSVMTGRECADCRKKRLTSQRWSANQAEPSAVPPIVYEVLGSPGQPLDVTARSFMEPRFGHDFSQVRVHTDAKAAESARAVNALAYTVGRDVVFGAGQYAPQTADGQRLITHELTHVVQQGERQDTSSSLVIAAENGSSEREAEAVARQVLRYGPVSAARAATPMMQRGRSGRTVSAATIPPVIYRQSQPIIQRRVSFNVIDWSATKLGPPTLQNGADPRFIDVPPTGQISISALVEVNGAATDPCADHEIGTTQTAWVAWTAAHYQGRNPGDGRINVRHRPPMPMRDPGPSGSIWYDLANVRKPGSCGDSVGIFHIDSPWHSIPKMRNNSAVAGNPLNFLRSYTRGLHLVTYLTARDPGGAFLREPLRFVYWNSLQDFTFTPNFANPLAMWAHRGQVQTNIGAKGRGVTADAPYSTTAGVNFGDHFNNSANWTIDEQP